LSYEDIRDNFDKSAKFGIDTKFNWIKDQKIAATDLVKEELLPLAKAGLKKQGINPADIDRYMDIIEGRAEKHMNGARWMLRTFTKLKAETTTDEALAVMTAAMVKNQELSKPVHTWEMPTLDELQEYRPSTMKVEEFMETDLFTVQKDDIISLVAEMMDWRKIRYMPVEDKSGKLIGLVTSRILLRYFSQKENPMQKELHTVEDVMIKDPITISAEATIMEALDKLRLNKIGCLPVVKGNELIGVITEMDFLRITGRLLDRLEK
jgi:CBS domain-containing protein